MTIKEFLLSLSKPWRDIKEYVDSRIQFAVILLEKRIGTIIQPALEGLQLIIAKLQADIKKKQDKLTAGKNISIKNNVISATAEPLTAGKNITIGDDQSINAEGYDYDGDMNTHIVEGDVYMYGVGGFTGDNMDDSMRAQQAFCKVIEITQEQYDLLDPPEPTTLYIIIDAS